MPSVLIKAIFTINTRARLMKRRGGRFRFQFHNRPSGNDRGTGAAHMLHKHHEPPYIRFRIAFHAAQPCV